jgi:uncharacterized damage-inducible protein DinB
MSTVELRLSDRLAMEITHEAISTRKMLERVPDDKLGWAPHEKSMTLGRLASHIAELPAWGPMTLDTEEMSMSTGEYKPWIAQNHQELVAKFDEGLAAFQKRLQTCPNEEMMVPWKFIMDGKLVFELPRAAVLRSMVLSHLIHHRGQLSVYLRLLDVPVPSIYGPSADEQG